MLDTELPLATGTDEVIVDDDQYLGAQQSGNLRADLPDVDFSASIVVAATLDVGVCHDVIVTDVRADGSRLELHGETEMIDLPVNTGCPDMRDPARMVLQIDRTFLTADIDNVVVYVDGQEQDPGLPTPNG